MCLFAFGKLFCDLFLFFFFCCCVTTPQVKLLLLLLLLLFTLQHCVSGDIRDLVKERWYKSLHADRLTPTTGVAEELLHKLKYLYKDSYS